MFWWLVVLLIPPPSEALAHLLFPSQGTNGPVSLLPGTSRRQSYENAPCRSALSVASRQAENGGRSDPKFPPFSDLGRREWLGAQVAAVLAAPSVLLPSSSRGETVGTDGGICSSASPPTGCIGVIDGLLADCPHDGRRSCTSSQDDTPGVFAEPWDYSDSDVAGAYGEDDSQISRLVDDIFQACAKVSGKMGTEIRLLKREGRYLRLFFTDKGGSSSTGEFYITPNDTTVQFRISLDRGGSGTVRSIERAELIRKQLRFTKLPVMRNRQRVLLFGESAFDTFGPGSASLGPPAEMSTGELEGRDTPDPTVPLDFLPSPVGRWK